MDKKKSMAPMTLLGQVLLYALFAVVIGVFSRWPAYQPLAPDQAMIKLSFSHHGKPVSECRQASAAELAKLPPNMRAPLRCPRERSPVTIELIMAGLSDSRARSGSQRLRIVTKVRPQGWVRDSKAFQHRAQLLVRDLKQYFAAE